MSGDEEFREIREANKYLSRSLSNKEKIAIERRLKDAGLWSEFEESQGRKDPPVNWAGRILTLALLNLWEKEKRF